MLVCMHADARRCQVFCSITLSHILLIQFLSTQSFLFLVRLAGQQAPMILVSIFSCRCYSAYRVVPNVYMAVKIQTLIFQLV